MKKIIALLATLCLATLLIAGCGGSDKKAAPAGADKKVTLKVGATPVPHAEILNLIKPTLAKEGVDLQVI